jgi:RimJ/RimL family protein N-acetyltransferase
MRKKILDTERLVLEELDQGHFDELAVLLSNVNVHRYFPKTLDIKESIDFLETVQKRQKEDGISFWAVIRKKDHQFLGICGLLKQIIEGIEEIEVGYRIDDKYWGKGYGTEAAAGCLKYAKEVLGLETIISLILPINLQSVRVAEKNGLKLEKEVMFHEQMHRVYRIDLEKVAERCLCTRTKMNVHKPPCFIKKPKKDILKNSLVRKVSLFFI